MSTAEVDTVRIYLFMLSVQYHIGDDVNDEGNNKKYDPYGKKRIIMLTSVHSLAHFRGNGGG